jgi:hypothetical protein
MRKNVMYRNNISHQLPKKLFFLGGVGGRSRLISCIHNAWSNSPGEAESIASGGNGWMSFG